MTPRERGIETTFPGSQGGKLAARLHLPDGPARAAALFAHCFTCSKESRAASQVSRALAREGIATLRFDFTGHGESEGEFSPADFSSNVDDLVAAAAYLSAEHEAPSILIGHSLGGTAALMASNRIPSVEAIATIGAPFDPSHVRSLLGPIEPELEAKGEARVSIAGQSFRIKASLLDDLDRADAQGALSKLDASLLVFHSPDDEVVDISDAHRIFEAAEQPKSFVALEGAGHLLGRRRDARYVASLLAAWAARHLPEVEEPLPEDERRRTVVVESTEHGIRQRVLTPGHELIADEPSDLHGTDLGPNPYEYLLAGLGACTNMTLRLYADRKKWPLEGVKTTLRHSRVHAEDCSACEKKVGFVDHIEKTLEIVGPLDDEQRARLRDIAGKCPVHRSLKNEVRIETTLA